MRQSLNACTSIAQSSRKAREELHYDETRCALTTLKYWNLAERRESELGNIATGPALNDMELRGASPFDLHQVVRPYCAPWLTISTRPCTCRCFKDSASFVDRVGKLSIRSGGTWSQHCSACALIRQNREIPRRCLRCGGGGSKSCHSSREWDSAK